MKKEKVLGAIAESKVIGVSSSYFLKPNIDEWDIQEFDDQSYVRGEIEAEFIEDEALEEILKRVPESLMGDADFILSLIKECRVHFFRDENDIDIGFNLHISTPFDEVGERERPFEVKSIRTNVELILNYADSRLFSQRSFILELLNKLKVRIGPLDYSEVEMLKDWSTSVSGYYRKFIDTELLKSILRRTDPELSRDEDFALELLEVCRSRSGGQTVHEEYGFPEEVSYDEFRYIPTSIFKAIVSFNGEVGKKVDL